MTTRPRPTPLKPEVRPSVDSVHSSDKFGTFLMGVFALVALFAVGMFFLGWLGALMAAPLATGIATAGVVVALALAYPLGRLVERHMP